MKNKVLVVAVHPDDETLGCGGTLLKHKANGDEIYWMIITAPTLNHPNNFTPEFIEKRNNLIDRVSAAYGFDETFKLNFPTQLMHTVDLRILIKSIEEVFNKVKPNIIYTMFKNDVHSDHRVSFDAVYSCTKSFRKPYVEQIYMIEALSETEFAPSLQSTSFIPNVYVDITDYMEKKLDIMSMFDTEVMKEPYPRSLSSIEALARVRGSRAGVKYAEAFMSLYEKR